MGDRPAYTKGMRAANEVQLQKYRKETEDGEYDLLMHEVWWRDRFAMLESHGYRLRPRYHPDWKPSWLDTDVNPTYAEDSVGTDVRFPKFQCE